MGNNSGPAFPTWPGDFNFKGAEHGMTLRDYFAAKAMQAMMGNPEIALAAKAAGINKSRKSDEQIALVAYSMADEMLKAREA